MFSKFALPFSTPYRFHSRSSVALWYGTLSIILALVRLKLLTKAMNGCLIIQKILVKVSAVGSLATLHTSHVKFIPDSLFAHSTFELTASSGPHLFRIILG